MDILTFFGPCTHPIEVKFRTAEEIEDNDRRAVFLRNISVTREANKVKFKTLMQGSWAHKSPNICTNRSMGSSLRGEYLLKVELSTLWAPCTD